MVGPFLGRGPALSSVEQQGGAHGAMGLWVHEPMVTHTACGQNRSHGKANPGAILVRWLVPGLGCPIGQLLLVGRAGEAAIGHLIKPSRPLSRFFHALSSPVSLLVSRRDGRCGCRPPSIVQRPSLLLHPRHYHNTPSHIRHPFHTTPRHPEGCVRLLALCRLQIVRYSSVSPSSL